MLPRSTFQERAERASRDGPLLIMDPENLQYLCSSSAPTAMILPRDGDPVLLSSRMEAERARHESRVGDVREFQRSEVELREGESCIFESLAGAVLRVAGELEIGGISYDSVGEELRRDLAPLDPSRTDAVERMRVIKSREEIDLIREAHGIALEAYEEVVPEIDEDSTEISIAGRIYESIMSRGAMPAFDPIVAFGESSAFPHYATGKRRLGRSSVVMIDMGAKVEGYCSDITRMLLLDGGPAEGTLEVVRSAIEEASAVLEPGVALSEVDRAARRALGEESPYFIHGLGHGLGLGVHEMPVIVPHSDEELEDGMVFTVEPGLYYQGRYGVRWEEDFVCWDGEASMI